MKAAPGKGKKARPSSPGPVSTPGRKFGLGTPGPVASPAAAVSDNTKRKLAAFGAGPAGREIAQQFGHNSLEFLRSDRIRDREKRLSDHPEFNPRTLHVPGGQLESRVVNILLFSFQKISLAARRRPSGSGGCLRVSTTMLFFSSKWENSTNCSTWMRILACRC